MIVPNIIVLFFDHHFYFSKYLVHAFLKLHDIFIFFTLLFNSETIINYYNKYLLFNYMI